MKKNCLLLLALALLANSCDWFDDDGESRIIYPVGKLSITVDASWSDDLLKFVTPVLSYTDVDGLHEVIVKDAMTVDDIFECEGDVIDLHSQSWEYNFTYDYADGDTVAPLKLRYMKKEHVEIVDTATYAFESEFGVSGVSMWYINEEGEYDLKLYNHIEVDIDISIGGEGEKDSLDEVRYRGEEAKHFIDSLIAHPLERKIIFHKKNIEVE